jgi:hypothetical protein
VKTQKQIKEHRENFKKHQSGKRGEKWPKYCMHI